MVRLFLGNLSYQATETAIAAALQGLGLALAGPVSLPKDRESGSHRGFGFVEVEGEAAAAIALADGVPICGRPIRVASATSRAPGPRRQRPEPTLAEEREKDVRETWREDRHRMGRR
jgi:RNA recognition motif-containing protein